MGYDNAALFYRPEDVGRLAASVAGSCPWHPLDEQRPGFALIAILMLALGIAEYRSGAPPKWIPCPPCDARE